MGTVLGDSLTSYEAQIKVPVQLSGIIRQILTADIHGDDPGCGSYLLQEIVKEDPDVIEPFEDLEYYTSATGIARVAKAALKVLPYDSSLKDEEIDAKAVFCHEAE